MSLTVLVIIASILFCIFVLWMVRREHFLLKYSFLWLLLGVLGILAALFPGWVYGLSGFLGFQQPANFLFFICIIVLMGISLLLSAIVSKQSVRIKNLIQEVALCEERITRIEQALDPDKEDDGLNAGSGGILSEAAKK